MQLLHASAVLSFLTLSAHFRRVHMQQDAAVQQGVDVASVLDHDQDAYSCPLYAAIRKPSVNSTVFKPSDMAGVWYLAATTEPTTKFCLCNVMTYTVYTSVYRYTDTCYQDLSKNGTWCNETVPLGGTLSKDPTAPGFLHEGLIAFNHTVSPLSPTMVFDFKRDSEGVPTSMHVYACLGKIPPIVGKDTFSYLLYVKDPDRSSVEIDDLVAADRATGLFDLDNLVRTNYTTWKSCGVR